MTPYEFRTISHGKTIWNVEHYCLDHADAFVQAQKSSTLYEVQVGKAISGWSWKTSRAMRALTNCAKGSRSIAAF